MDVEVVVKASDKLGEAVLWSGQKREIIWADIEGSRIWKYDLQSSQATFRELPARLCSFAEIANSSLLLAGFEDGIYTFDSSSSERKLIVKVEEHLPHTRVNDGRCDRSGQFVFATVDETGGRDGSLYQMSAKGKLIRLLDGIGVGNSISFSPDGNSLYFADSLNKRIDVYEYNGNNGTIAGRRTFVDLSELPGDPDGSTIDSQGCLWNAHYGNSCITRYAPSGEALLTIQLPTSQPTCVCFGGDIWDTLFITSASEGTDLSVEPLAGSLFLVRTNFKGLSEAKFASVPATG
jgi:L-arabinonolactonase